MDSTELNEERRFLHDLAGPACTAIFLLDVVLENLQTRSEINSEDLQQLSKVYEALEKVKTLLHGRREVLIGRGVTGAKS